MEDQKKEIELRELENRIKQTKADLIRDFKKQFDKRLAWTCEEFAALVPYNADYIRDQIRKGYLKGFKPIGREDPIVTLPNALKWFEDFTDESEYERMMPRYK